MRGEIDMLIDRAVREAARRAAQDDAAPAVDDSPKPSGQ
jgi:ribonuclease P protein component